MLPKKIKTNSGSGVPAPFRTADLRQFLPTPPNLVRTVYGIHKDNLLIDLSVTGGYYNTVRWCSQCDWSGDII